MLDEMDGKQARRTGNSSPLGLIFDHGVDCFSLGVQTITYMRFLQLGYTPISYILLIGVYSAFHFETLGEYYCGTLYLPPLNGVTDGSCFIISVTLLTLLFVNNFMATPIVSIESLVAVPGFPPQLTLGMIIALTVGISNYLVSVKK